VFTIPSYLFIFFIFLFFSVHFQLHINSPPQDGSDSQVFTSGRQTDKRSSLN